MKILIEFVSLVMLLIFSTGVQAFPVLSVKSQPIVESNRSAFTEIRLNSADFAPSLTSIFLQFDTTRLQFQQGNINISTFDNILLCCPPTEAEPGFISFSAASNSSVTGSDILLATLEFETTSNEGLAELVFLNTPPRDTKLQDANYSESPSIIKDGTIMDSSEPSGRPNIPNGNQDTGLSDVYPVSSGLQAGSSYRERLTLYDYDVLEGTSTRCGGFC